jgi:pyridoxamine 5'-phosphate oxidase
MVTQEPDSPGAVSPSSSAGPPGVRDIRRHYGRDRLLEDEAGDDPFDLFHRWFEEALHNDLKDANAFVLATADAAGQACGRVLLLKDYSPRGFVFYTNYASRKGRDLDANPRAGMVFFWAELERQVRIEGVVTRVSRAESEEYFRSRPRESQLGAHASLQSSVIASREELEESFRTIEGAYGDDRDIPLPDTWGGYLLSPTAIEFWQGRSSRLHDRLLYVPDGAAWSRSRLSP